MSRPEMAVGRRITALTCFLQGAFEEAQINAEEALKRFVTIGIRNRDEFQGCVAYIATAVG
jgi:hypothetical protein